MVSSSVGSEPAVSRLGHRERGAQVAGEQRVQPLLLLVLACRPARGSRSCPSPARRCRTRTGANGVVPRISCISPSLTWPKPWPPSSGGRCAAHSPRSVTCSCSGAIARRKPVLAELVEDRLDRPDLLAHERRASSPAAAGTRARSRSPTPCVVLPSEWSRCLSQGGRHDRARSSPPASPWSPGAALQSATGFGFALLAAPLLFAATRPARGDRAADVLGDGDRRADARRPRGGGRAPMRRRLRGLLAWAVPGALAGVAVLRALDAVALQLAVSRRRRSRRLLAAPRAPPSARRAAEPRWARARDRPDRGRARRPRRTPAGRRCCSTCSAAARSPTGCATR